MHLKNLYIQFTKDNLTIRAEIKPDTKIREKVFTKSEFYYGKFTLVITLSANIKTNDISTDYKEWYCKFDNIQIRGWEATNCQNKSTIDTKVNNEWLPHT